MKETVVNVKMSIGIPNKVISHISKNIEEVIKNKTYSSFINEVNKKLCFKDGSQESFLISVELEKNIIKTVWTWHEECPLFFEVYFDKANNNKVVKVEWFFD